MKAFFQVIRKINQQRNKIRLQWKLYALKGLYASRIRIGSSFQADRSLDILFDLSASSVYIGDHFLARKQLTIRVEKDGALRIGNQVFFNNACSITCMGKISIGDHCLFGENVKLYDHNHQFLQPGINIQEQGFSVGEISIGNNCWIGSNVVILKNVTIGDNVVIGAGCVVHKSIPSNTVYLQKSAPLLKPLV